MSQRMRALHLGLRPHRAALAVTAGRFRPELYHGGAGSPLRVAQVDIPARPPGWVRIAPTLAGVCASDRKMLQLTALGRPLLAFSGLPREGVVPGHEVVGRVLEADPGSGFAPGDRVVPEPVLGCEHKGFAACRRCRDGDAHRCAHQADAGTAAPGLGFGFHARFGGGWAEQLVAPADRVHRVPDLVDDATAVLAEPVAIAVHAVLRAGVLPGQRALVIGPGTIGLSVIRALRGLIADVEVTAVGLDAFSDTLAVDAGAARVLHGRRRELIEAAASATGSVLRGNRLTGLVLEDGYDVVIDCVGSPQTIDDALRTLRPGGTLVLLGTSGEQSVDWTLLWHRELTVTGSVFYGQEQVTAGASLPPGRRRAMAIALELLADTGPWRLVTHRFALDEPVPALATAAAGPGAQAVKVVFDLSAVAPRS